MSKIIRPLQNHTVKKKRILVLIVPIDCNALTLEQLRVQASEMKRLGLISKQPKQVSKKSSKLQLIGDIGIYLTCHSFDLIPNQEYSHSLDAATVSRF
ncbi:hypothetical protein GCM10007852_15350 [Agaribacter marinus]|uniref:Uncharacterized protein n=1 Tax=Agaribacter marinus TaxID=1431249 RepID=A0AA37SX01_9ALTE|nr:hypothetical protein GCM10007852_15350 [Agaribacter marinus]